MFYVQRVEDEIEKKTWKSDDTQDFVLAIKQIKKVFWITRLLGIWDIWDTYGFLAAIAIFRYRMLGYG